MTTTTTKTGIYEVKKSGKWVMVRATSIAALDQWCTSVGIIKWRMVGMLSIAQMQESKSLEVVA
jgi:hypothetical protein